MKTKTNQPDQTSDWRCECKCSLGEPNSKECPCHPTQTSDWREDFKVKFNEILHRIYNLEILPDIQSRINERIPERGGFTLYQSEELEDFIQSLLDSQEQRHQREMGIVKESLIKEIKSNLSPDLKRFATEPIEKVIDDWFRQCEELGLDIVWQSMADDVFPNARPRPIKAITDSPLKSFHELIQSDQISQSIKEKVI